MSLNAFGHLFRFTTWGESHGAAIGCVVDGCPPRIPLSENDIQVFLDQRAPAQSPFVSQRAEDDKVEILSGVFDGKTTGTPISLLIKNKDQRSRDYEEIKNKFRPAHADYTYQAKYGIRDYRGGGRASARETALRVAAGAVARKIIPDIKIDAYLIQIGGDKISRDNFDLAQCAQNHFFCPDSQAAARWESLLTKTRKEGSSLGAMVEVVARDVPVGLGAPIYAKLDAELAGAMMSINAVKGVEIGAGFAAAAMRGEENADEMEMKNGSPHFLSNNAGGVLGGISSGAELVVRFAVKPTSSILIEQSAISSEGENVKVATKGRHDPCVGIRAVPVGAAMMACVLADHVLLHRAQVNNS